MIGIWLLFECLGVFVILWFVVSDKVGKLNEIFGLEKSVVLVLVIFDGFVVFVMVYLFYKLRCYVWFIFVVKKNWFFLIFLVFGL